MKVIIIEDELHNYRLLRGMVEELRPEWNIIGNFESVKDSVDYLQNNSQPDLILMDIQLNDGICFSIFEQVKLESMVIFTTAYDNYAIKAFKVNSIDYLLKPIKEKHLEQALAKFESFYTKTDSTSAQLDYNSIKKAIHDGTPSYRQRFLISGAKAYYRLKTSEIAYFYSENKVSFAVDYYGKEHIVDYTLDSLEEELDPQNFFRANRNTILNIDAIQQFEDYFGGKLSILLVSPFSERITISRLKASAFKQWIGK